MTGRGWEAWMMTAPGAPFEHRVLPHSPPGAGEAVVAVAGVVAAVVVADLGEQALLHALVPLQ